ncbi:MAG: hypothetical protein Q8P77_03035, partial [Candidatus Veblenbacteria bacterium]|nr:hypothetical protein [Candidatus Veblenbacteria bacterium]
DELIVGAAEAKTVVLLYERAAGTTTVYIRAGAGRRADELLKPFGASGDQHVASASLSGTTVLEAEQKIINHLRTVLPALEE